MSNRQIKLVLKDVSVLLAGSCLVLIGGCTIASTSAGSEKTEMPSEVLEQVRFYPSKCDPFLEYESRRIREQAAKTTGTAGKGDDKYVVHVLMKTLKDDDSWMARRSVAFALGDIGDKSAVPALMKTLNDSYRPNRILSAFALGKIGDKSAVPALIEALTGEYWSVSSEAAFALGAIGDKSAVPALINILKDGDHWVVRRQAAVALGVIRDKSAVPVLTEALKDEHPMVRFSAQEAIKQIQS